MLIGYEESEHVKFVSYSGKCYSWCSGTLVLEIDGIQYKFCPYDYDNKTSFPRFWSSGGGISSDYSHTFAGEWEIDYTDIPKQFRKYAYEIDRIFNKNVKWGCCGSCI